MNIVLLGSPASGKGTQAEILCREFGLYHLSTGEICRELAKTDTRIAEIMNSGKLIPAEEMTMYVINFLTSHKPELSNILFEGFPRFISQYEALTNFLTTKGDGIDLVVSLDVSKEVAIQRISARRVCASCKENYNLLTKPPRTEGVCDKCGGKLIQREDDNPKSTEVRFDYYQNNTKELIDYVDKLGKLTHINGERPIDEIAKEIKQVVKNLQEK
jgi:adenylate kinase